MKTINFAILFLLSISLYSCVSQDDYNKVQQENSLLKYELDDIKYGSDRLLKQATDYFNNNQLDSAEAKLNLLISKHNETKEAQEGRKILAKLSTARIKVEDLNSWKSAEESNEISTIESYISSHPNGKYLALASQKIKTLTKENEQTAYNNAVSVNTPNVWTKFIEDYPDRYDIDEIKKKIIKAEITEIRSSSNVSSLPSSYQTDNVYSENSTVRITNNTGYLLTVRYSGPDVTSVAIPAGGTRTVYLLSGTYQVGATAGSASCGGTESLHGNYTSSYTITTSTYRNSY
jgi:hypothetical protein